MLDEFRRWSLALVVRMALHVEVSLEHAVRGDLLQMLDDSVHRKLTVYF